MRTVPPFGEKFTWELPNNSTVLKNLDPEPLSEDPRNKQFGWKPWATWGGRIVKSMVPAGNKKRQGDLLSLSQLKLLTRSVRSQWVVVGIKLLIVFIVKPSCSSHPLGSRGWHQTKPHCSLLRTVNQLSTVASSMLGKWNTPSAIRSVCQLSFISLVWKMCLLFRFQITFKSSFLNSKPMLKPKTPPPRRQKLTTDSLKFQAVQYRLKS